MSASKCAVVRVFMSEDDRHGGLRLYEKVFDAAQGSHLAGATVMRGVEGFGASHMIHSAALRRPTEDLPIIVEVADNRERLEPFIRQARSLLEEANAGGLITIEDVTLIRPSQPRQYHGAT